MTTQSHGHARRKMHTGTYKSWASMIKRCYQKTCAPYKDYGGRGIIVCDSWRHCYPAFLSDMGERPEGYSLERIDNNGNYCPENCKWIPLSQQIHNRRNTKWLTALGLKLTASEWAERTGLSYTTIVMRMRRGISPDLIVTLPYNKKPTKEDGRALRSDAGIKRGPQKNPRKA